MGDSVPKKIVFVCTEDWFFYSHFLPLIDVAKSIPNSEVYLVTTTDEKHRAIENLGVQIVPVDFQRSSFRIVSVMALLLKLAKIFWKIGPDVIHFVALKPVIIGGLASSFVPGVKRVLHVTGQGLVSTAGDRTHGRLRSIFYCLIGWYLGSERNHLLVENPDDADAIRSVVSFPKSRQSILGGAGIDTDAFPALPSPSDSEANVAFVGRLIWSKGLDVAVAAVDLLTERGINMHLHIYGEPDNDNPRGVSLSDVKRWAERGNITWHGRSNDIVGVWRHAHIGLFPSRGGEGMPRAMLEAASCSRPVIVSDVPGCRHFVRQGVEGLIVPPGDPQLLADAIERLVLDPAQRKSMGEAARNRILAGYTAQHVRDIVRDVYLRMVWSLSDEAL